MPLLPFENVLEYADCPPKALSRKVAHFHFQSKIYETNTIMSIIINLIIFLIL